jgi:hypothetical protein
MELCWQGKTEALGMSPGFNRDKLVTASAMSQPNYFIQLLYINKFFSYQHVATLILDYSDKMVQCFQ